jgi:hypothetical protein
MQYLFFFLIGFLIHDPVLETITGVSEVNVYREFCLDGDLLNNTDVYDCDSKGKETILYKRKYKVDFTNQRVISDDASSLYKQDECIVYDKNNWRCMDGEHYYAMNAGKFVDANDVEVVDGKSIFSIITVDVISYWGYKIKQFLPN